MKKKWLMGLFSGFALAACALGFSACGHTHTYTEEVTNPTCTEQGYTTHTCECGEEYVDTYVEALGHSYTTYTPDNNATCESDGTKTATCDNGCGETDTATDADSATGHSFTDYVSDGNATYDSDGTKTATCDNGCGETDTITDAGTMLESRIEFSTLTVEEDKVSGTVSNATEDFFFQQEITVYGNVTYIVSLDKYGTQSIPAKEIPLTEGENGCYVLVMKGGDMIKRYEVSIYRKHMYTVSFENDYFPSEQIEEGDLLLEPESEPQKEGYTFNGWKYDFSVPVSASATIKADWTINTYTVALSKNIDGAGTVVGAGTFDYNTQVTLQAMTNAGYTFLGWYDENDERVTSWKNYTFTLKEDRSFVAKWDFTDYQIKATAETLGGSITGAGTYHYGDSVTLTATTGEGYEFVGWYENGMQISADTIYAFTVTDNRTFLARWKKKSYMVDATNDVVEAGTITGGGTYYHGDEVKLIVAENEGYKFLGWYDGNNLISSANPYVFTATRNVSLTAKWKGIVVVKVLKSHDIAGIVTGGGSYEEGETVTLTATTTDDNCTFLGWFDGEKELSTQTTYTFTATEHVTITAKWKTGERILSVTKNIEEAGTVTGAGTYVYGERVTLTATINLGYEFLGWYDEGDQIVESAPSYTFTLMDDTSLTAKWQVDTSVVFADDFSIYDIYGPSGATNTTGVVDGRNTLKLNWGNWWFDGIGDGGYDTACNEERAAIATDPADPTNKVLQLKTATTVESFFHLTPRGADGELLVLLNYEMSFRFKIARTSTACETDSPPWIGVLNRRTVLDGSGNYVPADGRFNSTNSIMTMVHAGWDYTNPNATAPYYFASVNRAMVGGVSSVTTLRGENGGDAVPNTTAAIYDTWHTYKVVVSGDKFDMYLNGAHIGGYTLGSGAGYNRYRQPGYVSLVCCILDGYIDDVVIRELD